MVRSKLVVVLVTLALALWSGVWAPVAAETDPRVERARAAAQALGRQLLQALGAQLASGTPADAITVCSEIAPAVASELSLDGVEIRRTSLRLRNPENAPDPWERAWLERLEDLHAAGELPREVHEVLDADAELRYLRPILVTPACLRCHGPRETLDPEVRDRLDQLYPDDHAHGFAAGDLRGAFSVRVRQDAVDAD